MSPDFSFQHAGVSQQELEPLLAAVRPAQDVVQSTLAAHAYNEPLSFVRLPFDSDYHAEILQLTRAKQALKPRLIFLIGIGGSNLGTLAVHQALQDVLYNDLLEENSDKPLFYCADALDDAKNSALAKLIERVLTRREKVLCIIVSKSGTTYETKNNAAFFTDILKKYHPQDYAEYIVAITDKNSALWQQAEQANYARLAIPQQVGGRFSVFSAVGLFPLALLGIDIEQLCAGARHAAQAREHAALRAAILFYHYKKNFFVHDFFIFHEAYQNIGLWYRQLLAESLGKQNKGMLPTVSMAVDLHSQIQLYFGGPRCRITTFISPKKQAQEELIFKAVCAAYEKEQQPFMTFSLENDAFAVGALLQSLMIEIVYLGHLMNVPVFDQPQVELYKKEMAH